MNCLTIVRFLVGQRQAIVDIIHCRASLMVGALFVLSAGFAREYDQEDLLHKPWLLIVPLVASLTTSFVLYSVLYLAARGQATAPLPFFAYYRRFLSLYWMTAPLAWLYAIPVEHFLSAADAVRANLSLLGIVSLWRVLLISRCASVLFGFAYFEAFFLVMLFADTLALVILALTPLPIFNIMGGIPLTESETVIRETASVQFFGGVSWLIWFIAALVIIASEKLNRIPLPLEENTLKRVSKPLSAVCIAALVAWVGVLPSSQPPQQLRHEIETDLQNNRVELAIKKMSDHDREEFPPHWDPPPWHGYGEDTPPLLEVMQTINEESTADCVKDIYFEKLTRRVVNGAPSAYYFWDSMEDQEFDAYMTIIESNPRVHDSVRKHADIFRNLLRYDSESNSSRRTRTRDLLTKLGIDIQVEKKVSKDEPAGEVEPAGEFSDGDR